MHRLRGLLSSNLGYLVVFLPLLGLFLFALVYGQDAHARKLSRVEQQVKDMIQVECKRDTLPSYCEIWFPHTAMSIMVYPEDVKKHNVTK